MILYTYGCSWTNSKLHENLGITLWPDIISNELGISLVNNGISGKGNNFIIKKILYDLCKFKKNDIIIIQFSYAHRLEMSFLNENKSWSYIDIVNNNSNIINNNINIFGKKDDIKYIDFVLRFSTEILLNDYEIIKPILLHLKNEIGVIIKYWFIDTCNENNIDNRLYDKDMSVIFLSELYNGLDASIFLENEKCRIMDEYPELNNDNHPNKKGQNIIANCILKSLKNNL